MAWAQDAAPRGTPDTARVQANGQPGDGREIIVTGRAYGQTQLTLWSADDQQKTYDLVVSWICRCWTTRSRR